MIALAPGKSTPGYVEEMLSVFGKNPWGLPNFRLLWSERKMMYFAGEIVPEYTYFDNPSWILETWLPPAKDAGLEADWTPQTEFFMGPYPRQGSYNLSKQYPSDWYPTEESVWLVARGIIESRDIAIADREKAIREGVEQKNKQARTKVAEEIVEMQDSASLGKIQQSVSGPKNTFRTPDDFGRDMERYAPEPVNAPKRGGKIVNLSETR